MAIMIYPTKKPNTVCIYVISIARTMPGTDTNVTPDKDVPTMPIETIYQGDFLSPRKNASLLLLRPVIHAISSKTAK